MCLCAVEIRVSDLKNIHRRLGEGDFDLKDEWDGLLDHCGLQVVKLLDR